MTSEEPDMVEEEYGLEEVQNIVEGYGEVLVPGELDHKELEGLRYNAEPTNVDTCLYIPRRLSENSRHKLYVAGLPDVSSHRDEINNRSPLGHFEKAEKQGYEDHDHFEKLNKYGLHGELEKSHFADGYGIPLLGGGTSALGGNVASAFAPEIGVPLFVLGGVALAYYIPKAMFYEKGAKKRAVDEFNAAAAEDLAERLEEQEVGVYDVPGWSLDMLYESISKDRELESREEQNIEWAEKVLGMDLSEEPSEIWLPDKYKA